MLQYVLKVAITAIVVVAVAETAKRSTVWAALVASLPLTSLLAFVWMHLDGATSEQIASLSSGILWLVVPSLLFFIALPVLLRAGWPFWPSMLASSAVTAAAYLATLWAFHRWGAGG
ncbi:MAG: hypothetical protein GC151_10010 [Betaproteobacteria bacterium]|nr:hypothetical protein [Betaproteobacteria bacterium]